MQRKPVFFDEITFPANESCSSLEEAAFSCVLVMIFRACCSGIAMLWRYDIALAFVYCVLLGDFSHLDAFGFWMFFS